MKKFLIFTILFLALAGAVDAGYLLIQTVSGKAVVCPSVPVGRFNLNQCNIVLATSYAKFLGLPTALYGLGAYLFFAILVLYELTNRRPGAIKLLMYLSGFGVLISAYFIYLQFFVIEAICFYCFISASLMTLIFILSIAYNSRYSREIFNAGV
ncbi:MAG: vitamin K epoxide reductase family protein [Candidatus Azambacteria bacterium]|nr:vitamin K epoxide reductase family protein [Candidatus Azambacteria bacterium]